MTTRILKLKYNNKFSKEKYIADIVFCGGKVEDVTILTSAKAIYLTIKEPFNFEAKFRETRSSKFLLN